MPLPWMIKLRIAAVIVAGLLLMGLASLPVAADCNLNNTATFFDHTLSIFNWLLILIAAAVTGFAAYFVSWPYGGKLAPVAVAAGLLPIALKTNSAAIIMQANSLSQQKAAAFMSFRWEVVLWLAVLASGFMAIKLAQKMKPVREIDENTNETNDSNEKTDKNKNDYIMAVLAVIGSAFIAAVIIKIIARDVMFVDGQLNKNVAAAANVPQVFLAVTVAFGVGAFVFKKFFNACYIWSIMSSFLVCWFAATVSGKVELVEHMQVNWPANFFLEPAAAILPVQMVCFSAIGAIVGYWLAVRYDWWKQHCS